MKRISIKTLLVIFVFSLAATLPAFAAADQYVPGEALVVIADQTAARSARSAEDRASALATSARGQAIATYSALSEADGSVYTLIRSETQSTEELIEALKSDPSVLAASPNWIYRTQARPNDPRYTSGELWGMTRIGAEAAWDITSGDETVYVAIMDTGIQGDHEDLAANVDLTLARDFTTSLTNPTTTVTDAYGHGTHISGTVGAVGNNGIGVAGVNWRVKLLPLKVMGDDGSGSMSMLVAAINYVVELLQADPNMKIAAVNFSLGTYLSVTPANARNRAELRLAFSALDRLGRSIIVCAAGNEGTEVGAPLTQDVRDSGGNLVGSAGQYGYPAAYPGIDNMIVVGAIDKTSAAPSFTNWSGRSVHLIAPGADILSTFIGNTYKSENGTSMATPHVSGAAALLAARNPTWTAAQIKSRLLGTADTDVNPASPATLATQFVTDRTVSAYGLLRIDRALDTSVATSTVRATQVLLNATSGRMQVDDTRTVTATVLPHNAMDKSVTWSTSNSAVLTVDDNGIVSAIANGTATITATAADGSGVSGALNIQVGGSSGGGGGGCNVAWPGALLLGTAAALFAARGRKRS